MGFWGGRSLEEIKERSPPPDILEGDRSFLTKATNSYLDLVEVKHLSSVCMKYDLQPWEKSLQHTRRQIKRQLLARWNGRY